VGAQGMHFAKKTQRFDFPEPPNKIRDDYSHNLVQLVSAADLTSMQN
jgi:hypothetical protein